ncbi:MAG: DNA polymerase III subunit epsilon, partial [Gammaproteobacteria bacterium]|nr:DNA polymerase III subunit epsilon [Gammaproteobacteria bacterium]
MRQVVLDTETTGLDPTQGHRVIEIGCVEIDNRKLTGKHFHCYLNPDREIDAGALEVHGLSSHFLADKPRFHQIESEFLEFIDGAELVIHNAPFDIGFLDHELRATNTDALEISSFCGVLDSLLLAREKHPTWQTTLDKIEAFRAEGLEYFAAPVGPLLVAAYYRLSAACAAPKWAKLIAVGDFMPSAFAHIKGQIARSAQRTLLRELHFARDAKKLNGATSESRFDDFCHLLA